MYWHAFLRLIHYIVVCQRKFPNKKIISLKFDLKSTYRRYHMDYDIVTQSVTQDPELDIAMLTIRLIFGGVFKPKPKPKPKQFQLSFRIHLRFSKIILLQNNKWIHEKYCSPIQDKIPIMETLSDDLPFEKSHPLIVNVPYDPRSHVEIYIDDFMVTVVDIGTNNIRTNKAIPLAIHVM